MSWTCEVEPPWIGLVGPAHPKDDQTSIWRIRRSGQHLKLFIMFLKAFLNNVCGLAVPDILLKKATEGCNWPAMRFREVMCVKLTSTWMAGHRVHQQNIRVALQEQHWTALHGLSLLRPLFVGFFKCWPGPRYKPRHSRNAQLSGQHSLALVRVAQIFVSARFSFTNALTTQTDLPNKLARPSHC